MVQAIWSIRLKRSRLTSSLSSMSSPNTSERAAKKEQRIPCSGFRTGGRPPSCAATVSEVAFAMSWENDLCRYQKIRAGNIKLRVGKTCCSLIEHWQATMYHVLGWSGTFHVYRLRTNLKADVYFFLLCARKTFSITFERGVGKQEDGVASRIHF